MLRLKDIANQGKLEKIISELNYRKVGDLYKKFGGPEPAPKPVITLQQPVLPPREQKKPTAVVATQPKSANTTQGAEPVARKPLSPRQNQQLQAEK